MKPKLLRSTAVILVCIANAQMAHAFSFGSIVSGVTNAAQSVSSGVNSGAQSFSNGASSAVTQASNGNIGAAIGDAAIGVSGGVAAPLVGLNSAGSDVTTGANSGAGGTNGVTPSSVLSAINSGAGSAASILANGSAATSQNLSQGNILGALNSAGSTAVGATVAAATPPAAQGVALTMGSTGFTPGSLVSDTTSGLVPAASILAKGAVSTAQNLSQGNISGAANSAGSAAVGATLTAANGPAQAGLSVVGSALNTVIGAPITGVTTAAPYAQQAVVNLSQGNVAGAAQSSLNAGGALLNAAGPLANTVVSVGCYVPIDKSPPVCAYIDGALIATGTAAGAAVLANGAVHAAVALANGNTQGAANSLANGVTGGLQQVATGITSASNTTCFLGDCVAPAAASAQLGQSSYEAASVSSVPELNVYQMMLIGLFFVWFISKKRINAFGDFRV